MTNTHHDVLEAARKGEVGKAGTPCAYWLISTFYLLQYACVPTNLHVVWHMP